jgi:LysM repeat protein
MSLSFASPQSLETTKDVSQLSEAPTNTYKAVYGEMLVGVAQNKNLSLEALQSANPEIDPKKPLTHGQTVNLPSGENQQTLVAAAHTNDPQTNDASADLIALAKQRPLFSGKPTASEVRQGQYGDCYYLASIAAVAAKYPDLIQNMIKPYGGANGGYTVKFRDGTSFDVTHQEINSAIASGRGAATGRGGDTWVVVLELALQKKDPNFATAGLASEVLPLITGGSAYNSKPADMPASLMLTLFGEKKLVMTASADPNASVALGTKYGLAVQNGAIVAHAYSVTSVYEKNGQVMVQLRNPWGDGSNPRPIPYGDYQKLFRRTTSGAVL